MNAILIAYDGDPARLEDPAFRAQLMRALKDWAAWVGENIQADRTIGIEIKDVPGGV